MKETSNLLIDVLSILPSKIDCLVQAPSLENEIVQSMMVDTEVSYYKSLNLTDENKEEFINQVLKNNIEVYFQSIQIKSDNKLLFEGYDGVEFGVLSKSIVIPDWFEKIYISSESCTVSNEW